MDVQKKYVCDCCRGKKDTDNKIKALGQDICRGCYNIFVKTDNNDTKKKKK